MTTALGVDVDSDGNGVDPLTHRNIIKRHWNNTGIMGGLTVSGRADLRYAVSAGVAVCSMGSADGYTEAYFAGGTTENAVSAGDGTYSRIDSVYLLANTGTPDNDVHCMAAQGTPAASPVAPTLPAGALLLQQMLVPAGASKTSSASLNGSQNYAIPYGGSLGRLAYNKVTADYTIVEDNQWHSQVSSTFRVATDRLVTVEWKACTTVGPGADASDANANMGSYFLQILVDGKVINEISSALGVNADEVTSFRYDYVAAVSYDINVTSGTHTVLARVYGNKGHWTYPVTFKNGRQLKVMDRGVAQ
jgi:hypothetical protein